MEKLEEIVRNCFDCQSIKIDGDKKFEDYEEFDSLSAMMLVDELEELLNVQLNVEEIASLSYNYILKLLDGKTR